ncbi:MmgE/PrpD family protein [Rhodococcus koreensis]|uniref:MmgE/PrpD family protein n=1 Tax=Rhodococcus koreensis TaxID=99653 RepID=UPI003670282C
MTIVGQLAELTRKTRFEDLPGQVVEECKRLTLDALGCAVSGHATLKGRAGVEFGRLMGGADDSAVVIGSPYRTSTFGAAFANGELINALDFDPILPPGHVTPYVLPGALATGEAEHADGKTLITAIAIAHEISCRIGRSMDSLRELVDGEHAMPAVFGYSSTVFGATAAIGRVKGYSADALIDALSIAGLTAPVNAFRPWAMHAPPTTIKYLAAGVLAQTAMTAAHMAELGHRGDAKILDDAEFGFPRYIGTSRWEPGFIVDELGKSWRFPLELSYRPYPHARSTHATLDALTQIVTANDLDPQEIDAIRAWGEPFAASYPAWQNRVIEHPQDALYSVAYALALGAHRVPPGRAWQVPDIVFSESVELLAARCTFHAHPDYTASIATDPASRPTRVEVDAHGATYVAECRYPYGSPSPDPSTTMSTADIVDKFRSNTRGLLEPSAIEQAQYAVLNLESVTDIGDVMRLFTQTTAADSVN